MEMHVPSRLQQHLPLAVLKRAPLTVLYLKILALQQYLLLTVCAAGCETAEEQSDDEVRTSQVPEQSEGKTKVMKQQYLPFTVCAEGCETAEEQSDDEAHISQVPEQSEGKTKVISNSTYRLRYAPQSVWQQRSKVTMRSAHLLPEQSEGETKVMRK